MVLLLAWEYGSIHEKDQIRFLKGFMLGVGVIIALIGLLRFFHSSPFET